MENVRLDDERLGLYLKFVARWNSVEKPEGIKHKLIDKSEIIEPKTHSNRAMWPDEKLDGIQFNREEPYLSGSVTPSKVIIGVYGIDSFDDAYEEVKNWMEDASLSMPGKSEFELDGCTIFSHPDELWITIDPTKVRHEGYMDRRYKANIGSVGLWEIDGNVVVSFDEDCEERIELIKEVLSDEVILIGKKAEVNTYYDEGDGWVQK